MVTMRHHDIFPILAVMALAQGCSSPCNCQRPGSRFVSTGTPEWVVVGNGVTNTVPLAGKDIPAFYRIIGEGKCHNGN